MFNEEDGTLMNIDVENVEDSDEAHVEKATNMLRNIKRGMSQRLEVADNERRNSVALKRSKKLTDDDKDE